jgi:hypothetical protein
MGVSDQHHAPCRALPPGEEPPVPIGQEAGWAPEPVWTQRLEEKSYASVGDRTPVVQSVVRHCTDWDTRLTVWSWWQTEKSCEIWGFYGGEDDDAVLLGFGAV